MTTNNTQAAIDFIFQSLKNIDSSNKKIEKEDVEMLFFDIFDEEIEKITGATLNDIDKNILSEHYNNQIFIDNYLSQRIPNYYAIISNVVAKIISEYMKE